MTLSVNNGAHALNRKGRKLELNNLRATSIPTEVIRLVNASKSLQGCKTGVRLLVPGGQIFAVLSQDPVSTCRILINAICGADELTWVHVIRSSDGTLRQLPCVRRHAKVQRSSLSAVFGELRRGHSACCKSLG